MLRGQADKLLHLEHVNDAKRLQWQQNDRSPLADVFRHMKDLRKPKNNVRNMSSQTRIHISLLTIVTPHLPLVVFHDRLQAKDEQTPT